LRDVEAKLALIETRVAESQSQQAALEALYRELAPSREELALTEVEQVLVLASQQLALAGNVQSALTALQLADAKLARMDRPQFAPLRRSLARDMDDLKSVPYVDVGGISAKLEQSLTAIDLLPLAKDERVSPPAPEATSPNDAAWLKFLREVWTDAKSLVRIEVSDRPPAPLITPPQAYFLRENLRLRLLAARLALLSRDQKAFRADLAAANGWLTRYFDTRSKPVQALSSTFTNLAATPMPATIPDLSRSLELTRALKVARGETAERAATPRAK
jgi:uroporphyrin-3 C-methyltransferase